MIILFTQNQWVALCTSSCNPSFFSLSCRNHLCSFQNFLSPPPCLKMKKLYFIAMQHVLLLCLDVMRWRQRSERRRRRSVMSKPLLGIGWKDIIDLPLWIDEIKGRITQQSSSDVAEEGWHGCNERAYLPFLLINDAQKREKRRRPLFVSCEVAFHAAYTVAYLLLLLILYYRNTVRINRRTKCFPSKEGRIGWIMMMRHGMMHLSSRFYIQRALFALNVIPLLMLSYSHPSPSIVCMSVSIYLQVKARGEGRERSRQESFVPSVHHHPFIIIHPIK